MGRYGRFERVALPLALAVLALACVLVYRDGILYRTAHEDASQAEQVTATTASLLSGLTDAETGQRGLLLTGKTEYLAPYSSALAAIHSDLAQLKQAITRPTNRERVDRLEQLVDDKLGELQRTIEIRNKQGVGAALDIVNAGHGKVVMDEIRATCSAITDSVRGPMLASQRMAEESAVRLRWVSTGSLLFLFFLLLAALVSISRATSARQALIHDLDVSRREASAARDTLDLTLRSIGDAVIATDEKGGVTFMNPAARSLTGWTDDGAAGQPLPRVFRIINERTRDTVENPVEKVLRLGTVVGLANHTILINKNGSEIPIDDSAAPIQAADGTLVGVVLVFRDISERRRAEKEIESGREELSRSNQALLRSNTDLERFALAVSHDLQEPLRTIGSFTQLLSRDISSPNRAEYIDFILAGVNRMNDLIRDLLEYSRLTHNTVSAMKPVNLQEVVGETLWNLQAQISETGASIRADALPLVVAERRAMVQLIQNLVGNAIKYAGERRPEVRITADRRPSGDWVVHVRDNGIGIDMHYADEIFGVFKRLHGRDEYGGTGIGLAICKRIVELHGGMIWVESEPGQGSTFSFTLPSPSLVPDGVASAAGSGVKLNT